MTDRLTEDEKQVLKTGAFGAVYLVSHADPGFFSMLRESLAASGALAGTTGLVREVLTGGAQPVVPRQPPEAVEAAVLPALSRSMSILREKAPDEAQQYADTVLAAVRRVAEASHGVKPAEEAAIEKIKAALGDEHDYATGG
ncbi:MAG TPA: hypothetical protein VFT95_06490 [Micromonosporaceae bacterium]|nr:hypothetical protein [Micromonosporaceae bacterium]